MQRNAAGVATRNSEKDFLCRYRSSKLAEEEILGCLYSISDNNSFLLFNRDPIERMIKYMEHYFKPSTYETGYSLNISHGMSGARLSHSHEKQYHFVMQSLMLWYASPPSCPSRQIRACRVALHRLRLECALCAQMG